MRSSKAACWTVIATMLVGTPGVARAQETVPVPPGTTIETVIEAPAPELPAVVDTVLLRDGSVIRGTVSESFPGRHVIIVSAGGQRYTFAWEQVLEVRYGAQAATVPPAQVPPPLVGGPGRPRIHIELTREATVRLYELTGTIMVASNSPLTSGAGPVSAARPVCMAPCDRVIDGTGGQSFFLGGDRLMPSRRFTLHEYEGDFNVVVKPGRAGVFVGGVMFTTLSLAPLLSGTVFLAIQRSSSSAQSLHRTGGALLGVGAGLLISGILMMALGRTRVEIYKQITGAGQREHGLAKRL